MTLLHCLWNKQGQFTVDSINCYTKQFVQRIAKVGYSFESRRVIHNLGHREVLSLCV